MQIRSLRFLALLTVVVIVACLGINLKKNRISTILAKSLVKSSRIIRTSLPVTSSSTPSKAIGKKTSSIARKSAITSPIRSVDITGIETVWFDDDLPTGAIPNSDNTQPGITTSFKNGNGYYLTAMNGGGWEVNVYKKVNEISEKFKLIDVNGGILESGDSIRLLSSNGQHYVSAHGGGAERWTPMPAGRVFANKTQPGVSETFVIRKFDGTSGAIVTGVEISLQSSGGFYLWSDANYNDEPIYAPPFGQLFANSTTVGTNETFTLNTYGTNDEGHPIITLKSSGGFYVSPKRGNGFDVNVDVSEAGSWENIVMEDQNGGQLESGDRIRLRKESGYFGENFYLSIYGGGAAKGTPPPNGRAYVNVQTPSTNETFIIRKVDGGSGVISDGGSLSIQTENGYYFCAEGGGAAEGGTSPLGELFANDTYASGDGDTFTIEMTGSSGGGTDEGWNWVSSNPALYSGTKAHQSSIATGMRQHYFTNAGTTLSVGIGDHLYTWVYLDPANMPNEIMLQWDDGTNFEHRAYWGANNINLGTDGTVSRKYMGGLPAAGSWVKLDVPASAVGLEGKTLNGMAFTQYGGRVTWDKSGKSKTLERVIVKLKVVPYTLEAQLPSETERQAQRTRIIQAQDALLSSITDYYPDSVKRFDLAPYLGLVVGSTGYQMLQTSQYVSAVYEDKLMAPATAENLTIVGTPLAWNQNKTGAGQIIVILDTGIDKNHPALLNKVKAEACFSAFDDNAEDMGLTSLCPGGGKFSDLAGSGVNCPMATCEHGTQVAGAAAGNSTTDNYYGVARDANLISIQIFSKLDNSDFCPAGQTPCAFAHQTDQMKALQYVYRQKTESSGKYKAYDIAAVNVSVTGLGTQGGDCSDGNSTLDFIKALRSIGIPVITPSGDDSNPLEMSQPACMPDTVSVGATGGTIDTANSILSFSNSNQTLRLLAPGGTIYAPIPGTGYNTTSGTSLAAAHVSGAWAVLKQQDPNASVDKISKKLRNNGVWITDQRNNLPFPRINIEGALSCLQNVDSAQTWRGEYYDNKDLSGDPVMVRDDGTPGQNLDKNLNDGSITSPCGPGSTGAGTNDTDKGISIRWIRTVNLSTTNRYSFSVTADKDVRFYVDSIEKTNVWETIAGTKTYTVDNLSSGNHILKLEYRTPQATATNVKLSWSTPPIAPVNLVTNAISPTQITLNWNNISSSDGIRIERTSGGGNYAVIATVGGNDTSYTDSGLASTTTYSYRIKAFNSVGETGYSNISTINTLKPIPLSPINLTTSAISPSQINLSWNNNSSYTEGFRIYRNGVKIGDVGASQTSYSDGGVSSVTTYNYHVTAYNTTGESGYSNQSSATTWRPIPAAPVNLVSNAISLSHINLSWNNNSSYTDGFRIYRNGGRIAEVGASQTSYADAGLSPGTTYTYQVTAYNTTGESGYSNQSTALVPVPANPTNFTATSVSYYSVRFSWTNNSPYTQGFIIEVSDGVPGNERQVDTRSSGTTYMVSGLRPATTYYFQVKAYNQSGSSGYSNNILVTTPCDSQIYECP